MAYRTINEYNQSEGLQVLFIYANDISAGLFSNMLLFVFFLIIMMGSYFLQMRRLGSANIAASFAIAGYVTAGGAMLLSLIDGVVSGYTLIITIVIAILGTLWLYLSGSSN